MNAAAFLAWRLARRLTQREAAALLGIGQKRVWAMEAGKAPVSKQTAKQAEMIRCAAVLVRDVELLAQAFGFALPHSAAHLRLMIFGVGHAAKLLDTDRYYKPGIDAGPV